MALTPEQIATYRDIGHVTVEGVFTPAEMDAAIADIEVWGREFLEAMGEAERRWYLEAGGAHGAVLRKLDNPITRPAFRRLAENPRLVALVEDIIGPGVGVYFSQLFLKPPFHGGPKPVHQDNFYAGPNDPDGLVTAWIALDAATLENGCLHFGDGTNRGPVHPHFAPPDEPMHIQVVEEVARTVPMTPYPVPKGGVSFHHGNTFHRSEENRSAHPRRAAAFTYVNRKTRFATPALPYDESLLTWIT